MERKPVSASSLERPYFVVDADLNARGTFYGGRLLAIIDSFAGRVAGEHAETGCVTRSMDSMTFDAPVFLDETLLIHVAVNRSWHTSMEIGVKVLVQRDGENIHVASAYLTFVAIDDEGNPTPVPEVLAETDEEIRRYHQADVRRRSRLS